MSANSPVCFVSGSPRFQDAEAASDERSSGAEAAWSRAIGRSTQPVQVAADARGHFAVALQTPECRFGAVDRFSTRSLFYSTRDHLLRFAESAAALAQPRGDVDPQALYDYLYFHAIPSPRTIFKDVKRLPAGHCAWQDGSGVHVKRYWSPSFSEPATSFPAARDRFLHLLEQAVRRQLDGSVPACFLSGGTDSSTIAGMIAKVSGKAPVSYSIGFEAEGYDEMAYARIAAKRFGTDHREHYITPADLVRLIPELAVHHDQPFGNSSAVPTYFCALQARRDGIARLLAGDGGDELFGGNTRYAKQRVFSYYLNAPAGMRRGLLEPIARSGWIDKLPLLKKGASYVRQAAVPMPDRMQTYNLLHHLGETEVLTSGFLARVDRAGPQSQQREVWRSVTNASLINTMLAFDWRYTLAENDLPKVTGSTAAAGVEVGYPLLDQDLVDFSSQLPTAFKVKGLKLRWFF